MTPSFGVFNIKLVSDSLVEVERIPKTALKAHLLLLFLSSPGFHICPQRGVLCPLKQILWGSQEILGFV